MIHPERIQILSESSPQKGSYVLYWMQQAQRVSGNHALEYAIRSANDLDLPMVVVFALTDDYPEANERHYAFMLEGIREVGESLARRGIRFILRKADPTTVVPYLAREAALLVMDRGYLRIQKEWRADISENVLCPVHQVETDAVIPVDQVSDKEEYAARTIRPKIHARLDDYLEPLNPTTVKHPSVDLPFKGLNSENVELVSRRLRIDRSVRQVFFSHDLSSSSHGALQWPNPLTESL